MPCAIDLFPLTPPSQDCLRAALAVLMNVTQNNRGGCERVVACGGPAALLPLLAQLVAGGGKSQGGHAPRPMEGGPVCVAAWPSSLPAACTLCMHSPTTPPAAAVSGCAHSRAELVEWVDELRWAGCGARARVGVGIGMPRGAGHRAPPPTRHAMAVPSQTTCSGCLGLLINLAEQGEEWQAQLRGLELAPARGSEGGAPLQLLPLLCELATGARVQGTARQAELRCRGVRFAQLCSTGPAPPPTCPVLVAQPCFQTTPPRHPPLVPLCPPAAVAMAARVRLPWTRWRRMGWVQAGVTTSTAVRASIRSPQRCVCLLPGVTPGDAMSMSTCATLARLRAHPLHPSTLSAPRRSVHCGGVRLHASGLSGAGQPPGSTGGRGAAARRQPRAAGCCSGALPAVLRDCRQARQGSAEMCAHWMRACLRAGCAYPACPRAPTATMPGPHPVTLSPCQER